MSGMTKELFQPGMVLAAVKGEGSLEQPANRLSWELLVAIKWQHKFLIDPFSV